MEKRLHPPLLLFFVFMVSWIGASAQSLVSLTIAGGSNSGGFTQNFDGLPSGGNFIDLSVTGAAILGTQSGIYTNQLALQPSTGAPNIIGAVPLAGQYSFGVAGAHPASDRALGSNFDLLNIVAGILPIRYGVLIRNDAGRPIQSMAVSYTGEQWYNDNSGTIQTLSFDYVRVGTNFNILSAALLLVGDATALGGNAFSTALSSGQLDFASPNTSTRNALLGPFELDGNAVGNRTALTGTITFNTPIPVGGYVLLRWSDPYDNGLVDHSLAIDDLAVTATLVPNQPPVAGTIPNQTANVGTAFNYTIPAGTFTDPDGGALTVSLAGLPPGLTYTGSTSAITGTPTATGPYTVTATVTDSEGLQASTQFTITVNPPTPPPIGILAPSNLSLCVGQPLSLTLTGLEAANLALLGVVVNPGLTAAVNQNIVTITGLTPGVNIPINLGINITLLGIPLTVNQAVTVTVLDPQPPTVTPATITTTQGTSNVLFSANCPSGNVTYTASNGTSGGSGTATATIPVATAASGVVSYSVVCQLGACVSAPTVVTATVNPAPPTNQPPIVANPIPPQSGTVGTPFTYIIPGNTFSDPENDPLTVSITNLPPGLNSVGNTISGNPTTVGTFTATVTATDPSNNSVSTPLVITISPANQPPFVANPIPPQSGTVGTPFTYTIPANTFQDPEGGPVTVSVSNLPPGLTSTGGNISGTPTQAGTFTATVTGTDQAGATVSTPLVITVNPTTPANQPPVAANPIPNQTGTVGTPFTYTIPANTFTDPNGDPLTLTASNLPPGLTLTGSTISGTPSTTVGSPFTVTVTATDPSGASANTSFQFTINPAPNQAPIVANPIPNQAGTVGTPFTYTIPANTFTDPNGDPLTLTASNLPPGLTLTGSTISGTPSTTVGSPFTVTVTATDPSGASANTSFQFTINPAPVTNQPPFVVNPIPPQSGTVGTPFTYTIPANTFSDPNGDPLTVSITNLPPGLTSSGGNITGTPTTVGTFTATVTATDPSGASVSTPLVITVNPANQPPFVANPIPPQSGTVGTPFTYTIPANTFQDPEGGQVTVSVTNLPPGLTSNGGNITGTPTTAGTFTATVTGTDPAGATVSTPLVITVNPPANTGNFAITGATVSCTFVTTGQYRVSIQPQYSGLNGQPVSFSIVNLLSATTQPGPYVLTLFTDNPNITLSATQSGVNSTYTFNFVTACGNGNQAPIVANPIPPQSGTVGTPFTYTIPPNTFSDPNGDPLTVSVTNLPPGLGSNGSNITGTPTTVGTFTATVTARDPSGATVSTPLVITVNPAAPGNQAPIVANPIPPQSGTVGTPFTYTIPANTFSDPNGDPLTVSVTNLPPGLTSNGSSISGTPTTVGTFTATVTARDPSGASVSTPLVITVNPPANTGNFAITGATVSCTFVTTGQYRVSITPQYSGLNGQPVSFSIVNLLSATTQSGPYVLTLYTDNPNITLSATQSGVNSTYAFNFVTACGNTPGNQAPIVANPIPPQSGTVGTPFTYTIPPNTFTDPNGDPLTVSVTNLPPGLGSNGSNITGTPTTVGTFTATVTARDPSGATVSTPLVITVNPAAPGNQAPIVANPIPPQSGTVGTPFTYTIPANTFSDPNGDPLTVSITNLPPGLGSNGGNITGTPTTVGTFTATVTARDPSGATVSTPLVITVNPAGNTGNFAITGATVSCTFVTTGQYRVSITPQYSGLNGQPVSFSIVNLMLPTTQAAPYILTLYSDNPNITLSATQSGVNSTYMFNFVTACGNGNPGNQAPIVANPIPPQSGTVGTPFTYTIPANTFTDPNGDPLTVSITNLPPGLGSNGGNVSGTPTTAGTYTATVTATDPSGASVSTPLVITVNPPAGPGNQPPVVTGMIPNQIGTVGTPFTYTVPSGVFTDPNGDPLTLSMNNLPPGLSFNSGNNTITGTPTTTVGSPFTVGVTARDPSGATASTSFQFTINPAGNTGNFAITGATVSCTVISSGQRRVSITPQYSGLNGQPVSFSIVNIMLATTQPAPYILALYTDNPNITLSATQSGVTSTYTFNFVTACGNTNPGGNQPPIVANPIPPQSGTVGTPFTFTVPPGTFVDPNGDPLTVTITNLPPGLGSNGGTVTGTPTTVGTYTATVTATDPSGASVSTPVVITINPANGNPGGNQAPIVANPIPPQSGTVGTPFTYTIPPGTFTDPNGDPLTVSITNLPPGLGSNGGTITGTPTTPGTYPATVTATDPSGASVSTPIVITINPAGNTGIFAITGATVSCTVISSGQRRVSITPQYSGLNGQPISFSIVNLLSATTQAAPYILSLYTDNPNITLSATQSGVTSTYAFNFVTACGNTNPGGNQPPVVANPIPPQSGTVGTPFTFTVPPGTFTDPNGDPLTVTITNLPPGLGSNGGTVTGTPTTAGTYTATVTATDPSGASVSTPVVITINPPVGSGNQAPIVANPIPPQSGTVGTPFTYTIPGNTFTDPNGDPLTVSITNLPPGLSSNGGTVTGTPTTPGSYTLIVTARDPSGASVNTPLVVTINPANNPGGGGNCGTNLDGTPLRATMPIYDCALVTTSGNIRFTGAGGNPNGGQVEFMAIGITGWTTNCDAIIDLETRTKCDAPPIEIEIRQRVNGEWVYGQSFIFRIRQACPIAGCPTIQPTNRPPVVRAGIPNQVATVGQTYDYDVPSNAFFDADGDFLLYTVNPLPESFTTSSGHFHATPTVAAVYSITVTAYDNAGGSAFTTFTFTVRPASNGRVAAPEVLERPLNVRVLGNPTANESVEIEIEGVEGRKLNLRVTDTQGKTVSEQMIDKASAVERQTMRLGSGAGMYLLFVSTPGQLKTVKIIKQ